MESPGDSAAQSKARPRLGAVLLAAGSGARLGGRAKALIRCNGLSLIRRQLDALAGAGVDQVVVVTGHARNAVEAEVGGRPVTLVYNALHADGQQGSARLGLAALSGAFAAVLIVLVDQPSVGAAELTELINAFGQRTHGHVLVPYVAGSRGNPVVIDDHVRFEVLAAAAPCGPRDLIDRRPELVYRYVTGQPCFVTDIDTHADLEAFSTRSGWTMELPPA